MQKSSIGVKEFAELFYRNMEIDPDAIDDPTLKSMYVELLAVGQDYEELAERIEAYLDAHDGRSVHGQSHADLDEQSYIGRFGLPD